MKRGMALLSLVVVALAACSSPMAPDIAANPQGSVSAVSAGSAPTTSNPPNTANPGQQGGGGGNNNNNGNNPPRT